MHLESGEPASFAEVQVADSRGNDISRVTADEQGAFTAYAPNDPNRGMDFIATLAGMTGRAQTAPGITAVDITVHAGAVLRGHVVDAEHQPVNGFSLDLRSLPQSVLPIPEALSHLEFTGSDFEIDGAPRTAFLLLATASSLTGEASVDLTAQVPAVVEIELSGSGSIRGIALDQDTRMPISELFVQVDGQSSAGGAVSKVLDGSFSVPGVATGPHQLTLRNAVYLSQRPIVLDGTELDLGAIYVAKKKIAPGTIGAWFVQATDGAYANFLIPGGPADQAGLRIGDRAISIDGLAVANAADATTRCTGAPSSQFVLEVFRAGTTVEMTIQRAPAEGQRGPPPTQRAPAPAERSPRAPKPELAGR